jgi:hypothetical protein
MDFITKLNEDWMAVVLGLIIVALVAFGVLAKIAW